MSIQLVMSSNHLILCHPLLLLPSIFPSIRVFSNELALHIRWPEYWSFSFTISPSDEYSDSISFRTHWFNLLAVQGTLKHSQDSSPALLISFTNTDEMKSENRETAEQALTIMCPKLMYCQPTSTDPHFGKLCSFSCFRGVMNSSIFLLTHIQPVSNFLGLQLQNF